MNLFDLAAKLALDSSEYEKGLHNAEKKGSGFGGKLQSAMKIGTAAVTAVTGAAVAMGGALVAATGGVAEYGDNIDKMSQKMGLSYEAFQKWDYVLGQSGVDINNMTTGLKTLTNKIDDAKNGGEGAQEMFAKLGISMEDLSNMSREDIFAATIEGFQKMEDSTERAALANDLFGKSGQELTPLFNESAQSTKELMQAAEDLGMVMSDDAVKASAAYEDSLDTLKRTFGGLKNSMVGDFLPAVTTVMDGLTKLFSGGGTEKITDGINQLVEQISSKLPEFMEIGGSIVMALANAIITNLPTLVSSAGKLILSLSESIIGQLPTILSVGLQILQELGSGIIAALPSLIPIAVDTILQLANSLIGNLDMLVDASLEIVMALADTIDSNLDMLVDAAIEIAMALADGLIEALPKILEKAPVIVSKLVDAIVRNAPKLIQAALALVSKLAVGIANNLGQMLDSGKQIVNKIISGIGQLFGQLSAKGREIVQQVVSAIGGAASSLVSSGLDLVKGVWQGISNGLGWIKGKITGWVGNVTSFIKSLFGISSPSKVMRDQVGKYLALGIGVGFVDEMKNVERMMQNAMPETDSLFNSTVSVSSARGTVDGEILALLRDIRANMGYDIVLSDGTLAGRMDKLLGQRAMQRARGNA